MKINNLFRFLLSFIFLFIPLFLFSLPKPDKIVHGCIAVQKTDNQIQITQKCPKAIIDWIDFSLNENEKAIFIQNENFSVLNRVVSDKISKIYGSIEATGKFYLINQAGILIGPKGSINASQVILSTLQISKEDYLGNKLHFESDKNTSIQNYGNIKAIDDDIYIISKNIENYQNILAEKGSVNLISSSDVLILDNKKDILIKPTLDGSITNKGNIKAIEVKLKSSNSNVDSFAINQKGLIEAKGFYKKDGKVILCAESSSISNEGKIIAKNEDSSGGKIYLLGNEIQLVDKASLDASGKIRGGEILIGGDYQGKNPDFKNAKKVLIGPDVKICADAIGEGNGGKVIVWSDKNTSFFGNISTKGGDISGDGGFVEISSKEDLIFLGFVNASALSGKNGNLLLDPYSVTITSPDTNITNSPNFYPTDSGAKLSPSTITSLLNAGTNVSLNTSSAGGSEAGDITIADAITGWTGNGNLTFTADRDILVNNNISWSSIGKLTLTATRSISLASGISIQSTYSGGTNITDGIKLSANLARTTTGEFTGISLNNATISSKFLNIVLNGTGGTTNFTNYGISLVSASQINSTENLSSNAATISITAQGGSSNLDNQYGVYIDNSTISSVLGNITITATASSGNSVGFQTGSISTGSLSSVMGDITIIATGSGSQSAINLDGNFTIDIGSGSGTRSLLMQADQPIVFGPNVIIRGSSTDSIVSLDFTTKTKSRTIGVGNTIGNLSIDNASISRIQDGFTTITIGDSSQTGAIDISGATFLDPLKIIGSTINVVGTLDTIGNINLTCDNIDISSGATIGDNGNTTVLSLTPLTPSSSIGLFGGVGTFNLTTSKLAQLSNNLITVNIGKQTTTIGDIDIGTGLSSSFNDFDVNLYGNTITLNNALTMQSNRNLSCTIGQKADNTGNFTFNNNVILGGTGTFLINGVVANTNTITGNNSGSSNWTISGANSGTVDNATFSNISILTTRANDTFNVTNGSLNTINLGGGTNAFTITGGIITNLNGSNGADTYNLTQGTITNFNPGSNENTLVIGEGFSISSIVGGSGNNTLELPIGTYIWTIDGSISTSSSGSISGSKNFTFDKIQNLKGSSGINTFNINPFGSVTSIISGNGDNTYNINGGDVTQSIITGAGDDIFVFADGKQLTVANGVTFNVPQVGKKHTLDYSFYTTPIYINLSNKTVNGLNPFSTTGFNTGSANTLININSTTVNDFVGNGIEATELIGFNNDVVGSNNVWEVIGENRGTVNGRAYSRFPVIKGTNDVDVFNFSDNGTQKSVKALGEADVFNFGFSNGNPRPWQGDVLVELSGGNANDLFIFWDDYKITATINGGLGTNELKGPNFNTTWTIAGDNSGKINPPSGPTNFTNIQKLTTGSLEDIINVSEMGSIEEINLGTGRNTISITGGSVTTLNGSSGIDTYNLTEGTITNFNPGSSENTFIIAERFLINSLVGGLGKNTLELPIGDYTWTVDGSDKGNISGAKNFTFEKMQNLKGSKGKNTFDINPLGLVANITSDNGDNIYNINGGNVTTSITTGTGDEIFVFADGKSLTIANAVTFNTPQVGKKHTLDYSAYTTPIYINLSNKTINGLNPYSTTGINAGAANTLNNPNNLNNLIGNSKANTTLIGSGSIWEITGEYSGTENDIMYFGIRDIIGTDILDIFNFSDLGKQDKVIAQNKGEFNFWYSKGNSKSWTGDVLLELSGRTGDDLFVFWGDCKISATIDGGIGTNELRGSNVNTALAITGANSGSISPPSGATNFTNIQKLTSGSGNNTLNVSAAGSMGEINLGAGTNTFSITGGSVTNLNGSSGTDTYNLIQGTITNFNPGSNTNTFIIGEGFPISSIIGGLGNNTLEMLTGNYTWTINGSLSTPSSGSISGSKNFTFDKMQNLKGSNGTNSFNINTGGSIASIISGNGDNTYNINGGDITTSITTGTGNDIFVFADSRSLTVANGVTFNTPAGGKIHRLDYTAYSTPIYINLSNETVNGLIATLNPYSTTGFNAGGSNTLVNISPTTVNDLLGNNAANTELVGFNSVWEITGINSGTVNGVPYAGMPNITGTSSGDTFNFSATGTQNIVNGAGGSDVFNFGFDGTIPGPAAWTGDVLISLLGGTGNDIFRFWGNYKITATINGGAGTDEIIGPDFNTTWTMTGATNGTIAPPIGATSFSNIDILTGGTANDTFIITAATALDINGGGGTNEIIGPNALTTWNITGANSGTVGPPPASINFSNIQILTAGTANDTFDIDAGGSVSSITLSSGTNKLDYQNYGSPISVNLQTGAATGVTSAITDPANISNIIGDLVNFGTITGTNAAVTWNITAANSGNITGGPTFSNINNLIGGSSNDTFIINPLASISGNINGGGGTNTLKVQAGVENTWNITSNNAGSVLPQGGSSTNFSNIQNLTGNIGTKDTFILADNVGVSGHIDGGACSEGNLLDYSAYTVPVSVSPDCSGGAGVATNILGGISHIDSFIGPAPRPSIDLALSNAYLSQNMINFDLKRFVEFNTFIKRYFLIYIDYIILKNKKILLKPKFEDTLFKTIGSESWLRF